MVVADPLVQVGVDQARAQLLVAQKGFCRLGWLSKGLMDFAEGVVDRPQAVGIRVQRGRLGQGVEGGLHLPVFEVGTPDAQHGGGFDLVLGGQLQRLGVFLQRPLPVAVKVG